MVCAVTARGSRTGDGRGGIHRLMCGPAAGGGRHDVLTLDKLTYAGHVESLGKALDAPNHSLELADIRDSEAVRQVFSEARPDAGDPSRCRIPCRSLHRQPYGLRHHQRARDGDAATGGDRVLAWNGDAGAGAAEFSLSPCVDR